MVPITANAQSNPHFRVEYIAPDHPDHRIAVETALSADLCPGNPTIRDFLADADRRGVRHDLVFGAYLGGSLVSAVVALESPGRSVLLVCQSGSRWRGTRNNWADAGAALLKCVAARAIERGAILLQLITPPGDSLLSRSASGAGFRRLTRLVYMTRDTMIPFSPKPCSLNLNWRHFGPESRAWFEQAIAQSYAQSMDCPELTGLRCEEDVLKGHIAAGRHDPQLWLLACAGDRPLGMILLSPLRDPHVVEVVYMGVAQPARGHGVGDALLHHGLLAARTAGARIMALAVDVRNTPARELYERWNFRIEGFRDAWIATHDSAKT